jgi:hypothetical protein
MACWAPTLSLLLALSPAQVLAFTVTPPSAPATVTVRKSSSPYRQNSVFRQPSATASKVIAPRFRRVLPAPPTPRGAVGPAISPLGRARACKVYDPNANGAAQADEQPVADWRFRLTNAQQVSWVRTTGEDGCATFAGLREGSYALTELVPPEWPVAVRGPVVIEVKDPTGMGESPAKPTMIVSSCVRHARMGSPGFWRGREGVQLMDGRDQQFVNSLEPFRSLSRSFAKRDGPFDGRFSDDVTTWQAKVSHYLGDRAVSADTRGRLAQELLAFALNAHHFLENAQVVYVEEMPIFVDDLYFEGIIAWHSGKRGWIRDMTAFLAAINGSANLPFVPHDHCQVAYLPF